MIGWCHNCMTVQHRRDARWIPHAWDGGRVLETCVSCEEPWGFGVWEWPTNACTERHADRRDVLYPGDCDCELRWAEKELGV